MNLNQEFDLLKKRIDILEIEKNNEINLLKKRIDILENEKNNLLEKDYQKHLTKLLKGCSHLKNKYGVTDITASNYHIEIKNWINYKNSLGQLIAYNVAEPREKLIAAFFGNNIKFKERAISLMHNNKIDVWELDIINNELIIDKHYYIPKETLHFIDNHLEKTDNNDKLDIKELQKYNIDIKFIPLVKIGQPKNFIKFKDIKDTLKKNEVIEKNVITLKDIIKETFEGVEFKEKTDVNRKNFRNIFLNITTK